MVLTVMPSVARELTPLFHDRPVRHLAGTADNGVDACTGTVKRALYKSPTQSLFRKQCPSKPQIAS